MLHFGQAGRGRIIRQLIGQQHAESAVESVDAAGASMRAVSLRTREPSPSPVLPSSPVRVTMRDNRSLVRYSTAPAAVAASCIAPGATHGVSMASAELQAALDAAAAAGEVIAALYRRNLAITLKADKSPVTEADVKAEEAIRAVL